MVVAILAIGVGLVVWKKKVGAHSATANFNSISRAEIELLLADVAKSNPMVLKKLKEDPEMKKQQVENLKQLLAFASEAKREGMVDDAVNRQELDNIRAEIIAVNYDREINKDKGPMPAFGFITEDQVKAYWAEDEQPKSPGFLERIGLGGAHESRTHQAEFDDFLNTKVEILKKGNPEMADREISEEEKQQARDIFAKIRIYSKEYETKMNAGELSQEFIDRANLQVKLQQAQFLARLFSEKATEQTKVTDEEVDKYIADHPELNPQAKRDKAQSILDRAKAGEDFAALANEFSEDPGNQMGGQPQGGLYKDVTKGKMVAPFEQAALAVEPGQVAPELVETQFGFHIVKLERKLGPSQNKAAKDDKTAGAPAPTGDTYDVRHILISTGFKDPDNPTAREMPVKDYVKNKLETEKEKKVIDDIVARNNVTVPDDFTVPEVTEEQIKQLRQKQMQQQPQPQVTDIEPSETEKPTKPDSKKPETKKK